MSDDDRLYAGRGGNLGDRSGNFAVQNSDLILSVGSRLSFRQTSFNFETWAQKAYVIMEDIDENELFFIFYSAVVCCSVAFSVVASVAFSCFVESSTPAVAACSLNL